ncbi:MAG: VacJ family lipoprotein [Pseudomonadota bacterium]
MLDFRTLMAVSLALTASAPLAAETGTNGPFPQTAALIATEPAVAATQAINSIETAQPNFDATFPQVIATSWSLTPGDSQQTASAAAEERQQDLEEGAPTEQENSASDDSEIIVEGSYGPPDSDPAEALNFESYRITQAVDDALVEPVAYAYRDGLPTPLRDGLGNVVRNLGEPVNALNFLLQGKFGKALGSLTRLLINSTLGLGGVFDIAEKPGIGLPYRRNGFANTLGFYGVEPGAYLYLPISGATTVRDLIGSGVDQLVLPFAVGKPFDQLEYSVPFYIVSNLDARLEVDEELARIDQTVDPYAARRDSYLARREREIALLKGEEPPQPPLILLEVEGVIEPGDDYPEGYNEAEGAQEEDGQGPEPSAPPTALNFERGAVSVTQIR